MVRKSVPTFTMNFLGKSARRVPSLQVREMIGRYEGPENILSQTGRLGTTAKGYRPVSYFHRVFLGVP